METLVLVRHAFAGSNRDVTASSTAPGEGLTPEGVEQAGALGAALAGDEIDLGVATELARTGETLELALGERVVPRLVVRELNEIGFGSFDGGPLDVYRAWAAAQPPTLPAPGGGESRADAAARFAAGLRLLLRRPEPRILAVGHALFVRYVLDAAHELPPSALMEPVQHAVAHTLSAAEVGVAAASLDAWSRAPRFRAPAGEPRPRGAAQ